MHCINTGPPNDLMQSSCPGLVFGRCLVRNSTGSFATLTGLFMRDFRLPPWCRWNILSSGILRSIKWVFRNDVLGQIYRSHLHESRSPTYCNSWPSKVGPIGYPETSVHNYQFALRNIVKRLLIWSIHGILQFLQDIPEWYLDLAVTASAYILPNLSFTNHPSILNCRSILSQRQNRQIKYKYHYITDLLQVSPLGKLCNASYFRNQQLTHHLHNKQTLHFTFSQFNSIRVHKLHFSKTLSTLSSYISLDVLHSFPSPRFSTTILHSLSNSLCVLYTHPTQSPVLKHSYTISWNRNAAS